MVQIPPNQLWDNDGATQVANGSSRETMLHCSMVTWGFMVSKSCCTYITRFREKHVSVRWVLNGFCGTVSCAELKGRIIKENIGKQLTQGVSLSTFIPVQSNLFASLYHLSPFSLLQPHDYMKTINVSSRPASNQLLAYDSHYLHLSHRVSGAQLGLRRQEGLCCWWESEKKGMFFLISFADYFTD